MVRPPAPVTIRPAVAADLPALEAIRRAAFAAVFAGFRQALGDALYGRLQEPEDRAQAQMLARIAEPGSGWELHVADAPPVVGFVALRLDAAMQAGEIGLNAVHPDHAGRGIGTAMYRFALQRMRAAGMRAATVATGGDEAHAPARAAYRKAGFHASIPSVWMCMELGGPAG